MSARAWTVVIVAGLAIVALLVFGDEDRMASGRAKEGTQERASQALLAAPTGAGAGVTISITTANEGLPEDVKGSLEQVQQLLEAAETQSPEQAKATFEEARELVQQASDSTRDAADDTSNEATRARLIAFARTLDRIEAAIQLRIDQL
jgi:hypothetical protein